MKIHSLQIINFKSYFGRHIIGQFNDHFTCIIGPNGNGKSNILDAMLFVFGFKSSKLRQDSLASLIHSSAYGVPQEAKVSVTFNKKLNKNKNQSSKQVRYVQKSFTQTTNPSNINQEQFITVSRTIRKNNYSFYQLNNKRIQWNQLRDFLLKQCIDLQKNLFIILQGQVQRLCELSAQKLVEYIQYVSGSDQYLQRINQLQSQYINGGIQMQSIKQSYNLLKKVYIQQEKQGFELLEHIGLRIKIVSLRMLELKKSKFEHSKQLQKYKQQLNIAQQQLKQIQNTLQSQTLQLTQLKHSLTTNTLTINQYQQQIINLYKQSSLIESQQVKKISSQIQYLIRDLKQKQKQIQIIQKEKSQLIGMEEMEMEIKQKATDIQDKLKNVISGNKHENQQLSQKNNKHSNQQTIQQKLSQQKNNKKQHKNKSSHQQHKNQSYQSTSSKPTTNLGPQYIKLRHIYKQKQLISKTKQQLQSQFTKQLQLKQTQHKLLYQHLETLIKIYGPLAQLYKSPQQQLSVIKLKLRQLSENQQKRQKQIHFITQSLDEINRRISQTQSHKSFVTLAQRIINQIQTANKYNILLPGKKLITLRQVVHIPIEYIQLINAITPQLDYIIVQNHNDAREIVNFLNSQKLGRMSLILMDQVKKIMSGFSIQWKGQKPKGCVRIIDIVKALDNQYQKILYWTMGNTLIAQSVQDAMKAAYHSNPPYRVISRNGVFIDLSGTMTKVPLQSLVQQDRVLLDTRAKVLQKKLQQETKKLSLIRQQKQETNKQLYQLTNNRANIKKQQQFSTKQQLVAFIKSLKQEIKQLQTEITKIKGNKASLQLQIKLKQKQLNQLIKQIKQILKSSPNGSKITFDELIKLVQEYENILNKIKKLQISQQLVKSLNQRLKKNYNQINQLTTKIQQKKKDISKFYQKIKQNKHQISQIEKQKKIFTNENSKIQQKIFIKQLDIKYLNGQITRQINLINNKQKQKEKNITKYNKKIKDFEELGHSQMPDIQVFSGQNNVKNKNERKNSIKQEKEDLSQDQKKLQISLPSSSTIIQIRKQQKQLKQQIQIIEKKINSQQRHYQQAIDSLRNIYQLIVKKCGNSQPERQRQMKQKQIEKNEEQKKELSKRNQLLINEKEEEKQKKVMKQNLIHFQDIIIDYIKVNGLVQLNQLQQYQKQISQYREQLRQEEKIKSKRSYQNQCSSQLSSKSSSESKSSLKLKSILNHKQFQFKNSTQKLIFNSLFNSLKLLNITLSEQYKFIDFLSNKELQHIIGDLYLSDLRNHPLSQQNINQDLLKYITFQKIKYLQQSYDQKLNILSKQSSSLLIKNIHNSPKRGTGIKLTTYHYDDINNPINLSSYFNDLQYPLNSWECQIIDSLIQKKNDFLLKQKQLKSIQQQQKTIYSQLLIIRQQRTTCYLTTFNMINIQVNKIYNFLTKGNAEINLVNSINPFQGLQFSVRPFNKSWKSVNLLSGGQKTLTSLALIFACEQIKKFPFYFMDQIDAALDYRNVTNLGKYIKSKENVQHIVISLRKNMYQQCDQLVCIYKVSDVTRTIIIGMNELYDRRKRQEKQQIKETQKSQSNASTITLN